MSSPVDRRPPSRRLRTSEYDSLLIEMGKIVQQSHLFRSLDDETRNQILRHGRVQSFAEDSVLMREGDAGDVMYIILRGRVAVETMNTGTLIRLAELGPHGCVGEVSLLTQSLRTATVFALTATDALAFDQQTLLQLLQDNPKLRGMLESLVEHRARDAAEKYVRS